MTTIDVPAGMAADAIPLHLHHVAATVPVGGAVRLRFSPVGEPLRLLLADLLVGAAFTIDELDEPERGCSPVHARVTRARSLADTVGPGMRLLVCGLNPSLYAADAGVGFARPGNRFWPAALAAGLVSLDRDPVRALTDHGIGLTDLVKRATPRADVLTADEYRAGMARVDRLAAWLQPRAICFVGIAGWRAAVDPRASVGRQDRLIGGRPVYVMPSTSGANAHASLTDLIAHFEQALSLGG